MLLAKLWLHSGPTIANRQTSGAHPTAGRPTRSVGKRTRSALGTRRRVDSVDTRVVDARRCLGYRPVEVLSTHGTLRLVELCEFRASVEINDPGQ